LLSNPQGFRWTPVVPPPLAVVPHGAWLAEHADGVVGLIEESRE